MQQSWECPNCNSAHVVPDGRTIHGVKVLYCTNCYSWFDAVYFETVLFVTDGGDDQPDELPAAGAPDIDELTNEEVRQALAEHDAEDREWRRDDGAGHGDEDAYQYKYGNDF
jgi:hypothetical protein